MNRKTMEWLVSVGTAHWVDENTIHIPRIVIKGHRPYCATYKLLPDEPGIPCTVKEKTSNE